MKNLLILRHAATHKSGPDGTDFTRPLTPDGIQQAEAQGRWIKSVGIQPGLVLSSTAIRARETAEALVGTLGSPVDIHLADALYNVPGAVLLETVRGLSAGVDDLVLVAHMPGVAELVALLTTECLDLSMAFEPCTLASVRLDHPSWSQVSPGQGVLHLLVPPLMSRT